MPPQPSTCHKTVILYHLCGHTDSIASHLPTCCMHASYESSSLISYLSTLLWQPYCPNPKIHYIYDVTNVCSTHQCQSPFAALQFPPVMPPSFTRKQLLERRVRYWNLLSKELRIAELQEYFALHEDARKKEKMNGVPFHLQTHILDPDGYAEGRYMSLFNPVANTDEMCTICTHEMARGKIVRLPCSGEHEFHYDCVLPWIEVRGRERTCPCCRCVINVVDKYGVPEDGDRLRIRWMIAGGMMICGTYGDVRVEVGKKSSKNLSRVENDE